MNKREARQAERKREQKRQQYILYGAIIAGIILVAAGLALPSILAALEPVGDFVSPALNPRPMAKDNAMGDPNAPVKIEEFSDFQCPYCAQFHAMVEPQVVQQYIATGKAYFVYIPLYFIGAESKSAAEAAFCAKDQGKFWEYKDYLFANHTGENIGDYKKKRLQAFGEKIGLDMTVFNNCLGSGKHDKALADGKAYADKNRIDSTPSFLVNGKLTSMDKLLTVLAAESKK